MPYGELRGGRTQTSPVIRAVYPKAGSTITVADGDFMGNYDGLLAGVLGGDIQLFRGWFGDPRNQDVKCVYREADYVRRAAVARPKVAPLADALASDDPVTRYAALDAVTPGRPGAAEAILTHAPKETDWVIRKRIAQALGTLGDGRAVELLAGWVRDPRAKLDHFAAEAMGKIGPPAAGMLIELAGDADQRVAVAALGAFSKFDAPRALPTILKLADSENRPVRVAALRALGAQHGDAAVSKLIALLGYEDRIDVLVGACESLGRLRDRRAVNPLVETIERAVTTLRNNPLREAAGDALEAITGKQFGPYERRWLKALGDGKLKG